VSCIDLQEGSFRDSTEAVNFLKQIYPDYFEEHPHVCRLMDQRLMFHAGANVETFPLHALLGNVATQDHIDDSDMQHTEEQALSLLVNLKVRPSDHLEGQMLTSVSGADLVLWQLGLRISFGSGSVHMLRGHEVKHSPTDWYAIVEAMPATGKRAAAVKRDQHVEINNESENSCPGHKANYTTPQEEEIDVYRFRLMRTMGNVMRMQNSCKCSWIESTSRKGQIGKGSTKARKVDLRGRRPSRARTEWSEGPCLSG
jgi:hypothetical protein